MDCLPLRNTSIQPRFFLCSSPPHYMPVPSHDLDFQHHMSWFFLMFSELRWDVVVRFVEGLSTQQTKDNTDLQKTTQKKPMDMDRLNFVILKQQRMSYSFTDICLLLVPLYPVSISPLILTFSEITVVFSVRFPAFIYFHLYLLSELRWDVVVRFVEGLSTQQTKDNTDLQKTTQKKPGLNWLQSDIIIFIIYCLN
jgi:hypothetical protein